MTDTNPYSTPAAAISATQVPDIEIPEEISRPIKHGWVAACVTGALTLVLTLLSQFGASANRTELWNLLDVGLVAVLAFGIYRKSRIAATLMLCYFAVSKILMMIAEGMPTGLVVSFIFLIFYFRATVATFRYHRFLREVKRSPPPPRRRLSDDPFFQASPAASANAAPGVPGDTGTGTPMP
ncbi:hypothetical protein ACTJI2_17205 [Pseudoxanthomonas sp. 22568]|uniref:hypothetical protein n=1 Tax=Pseudoxanthomonas sp. 22568 TaxID=3453945 RepID=UPI003F82D38E